MSKSSSKPATKPVAQWRTAVSTRGFTVMVGLGIVVLGVALTKELIRKIQIHRQIEQLESEITSLESEHADLTDMIAYFNSSSFQEKEARTKLGLTATGETMAVLPDTTDSSTIATAGDSRTETASADGRSNPQKWQDYFFKH
jgi:cell division protein FtsB